eukprot:COSAG06_NODE_485_length_15117_cov_5.922493_13_plen_212_part_00
MDVTDAQLKGCGALGSSAPSVSATAGASRSSPVRPAPRARARLQLWWRLAACCCVLRNTLQAARHRSPSATPDKSLQVAQILIRGARRQDAGFWWLVCIRRAAARCSRSAPRSPPSRPGAVARATAPCRTGPRTRRSASRRSTWWPCAPAGRACMARLPAPRTAWRRALRIPACHSPLSASGVNRGTRMPLPGERMQSAARPTNVELALMI